MCVCVWRVEWGGIFYSFNFDSVFFSTCFVTCEPVKFFSICFSLRHAKPSNTHACTRTVGVRALLARRASRGRESRRILPRPANMTTLPQQVMLKTAQTVQPNIYKCPLNLSAEFPHSHCRTSAELRVKRTVRVLLTGGS